MYLALFQKLVILPKTLDKKVFTERYFTEIKAIINKYMKMFTSKKWKGK